MKTYKAQFNKGKSKGVFAISLVERPAMEGLFIALSETEQPIKFATVNTDKQILVGLVLEPNKPIFRVNEETKEEYNMVFDEDTIQELAYNFFQSNSHHNSTLEHVSTDKLQDITFVESWIVEDKDKDKSNKYGLSYPVGSWMATMKVNNNEVWEGYVKTGKVLGFSIDAMLSLEEVQTLNKLDMNTEILNALKGIPEAIKLALTPKEVEIKMGSVMTSDGVAIEYDGDMLEVGMQIFVMDADGNRIMIPTGEYQLEDGSILVVTEEGIAGEVKAKEVEEEASAEVASNDSKIAEEISSAIKSVLIKYNEVNEKVETLLSENVELKAQIIELSKQPAAKPISSKPVQVDLSAMTSLEKHRFFKNQLKNEQ